MMTSSWIWQQPDWPQFRWEGSALEPLLEQARAARQELLSRLETLEPPLDREAISALLGRESLGTAANEGELLDPGQVRSSIARRLRLPLAEGQPAASAQVEGLLDVLMEATSSLDAPLTLATLNHWHQRLFAGGPDGLRAIRIGELRDGAPMQVGFPSFSVQAVRTGKWRKSTVDCGTGARGSIKKNASGQTPRHHLGPAAVRQQPSQLAFLEWGERSSIKPTAFPSSLCLCLRSSGCSALLTSTPPVRSRNVLKSALGSLN